MLWADCRVSTVLNRLSGVLGGYSRGSRRVDDLLMQYLTSAMMHHLARLATLIVLVIVSSVWDGEPLALQSRLLGFRRGGGSLVQDLSLRLIFVSFTCKGCIVVNALFIRMERYCINN